VCCAGKDRKNIARIPEELPEEFEILPSLDYNERQIFPNPAAF
jgi:hypothetical protein